MSLRKCGVFGVSCEPLSFQVNYLIDEDDDAGKGSNSTVSMLHHFLETHGIGEKHLEMQADNCVGQNKNNNFMRYLMWRTMTGKNETIQLSFMIVGHTKFAPDRFFGMVKKNYKRTFVSTLDDIQNVVKKSMLSGQNIPQVTKTTEGRRLVTWYDWKSMFSVNFKSIPNITCYHHFRFDHKFPGKVFVQELVNSPELEITILSTIIDPRILPEELVPKGMDINRR